MNVYRLFFFLLLLSLLPPGVRQARAAEADTTRPNIIVILADDLGYGDVGFNGAEDIPTPNIDAIAEHGIRFSNGYVTHSFCSPSRAGLLTGRYQQRFGYQTNVPYDPHNPWIGLPNAETTFAKLLQEAGYTTAAMGKWHLGAHASKHPNNRGFDFFYGFLGGGHDYFSVDLTKRLGEGYHSALLRNGTPEGLDGYLTTVLSKEAAAFIDRNHERPFFLYLAYNAPHTPQQAPEKHLERFSHITDSTRRVYAAMVSAMDDGVGRVLEALARHDLREETIVFFLSDNGGPPHTGASNAPLRGYKGSFFEGGIRVPFAVSWPGVLPEGVTYDAPILSLDIAATALAVAGVASRQPLDGVNLLPYLTGETDAAPHEALYWRSGRANAIRKGDFKLIMPSDGAPMLFHLAEDLGEAHNLAEERPEKVRRLRERWQEWNAHMEPRAFWGFIKYHEELDAFFRTTSTYDYPLEGKNSSKKDD